MDIRGREYVREKMPMIGFGTYLITNKKDIHSSIDAALAAGYRFIDTAQIYRNEKMIGDSLKELLPKYGLKREDIFITSKVSPQNNGAESYESVRKSLQNLQTDYVDLFIIHWPGRYRLKPSDPKNSEERRKGWEGLERAYNEGLLRAIGVSNYLPRHLDELMEYCTVHPALNQCEYHPAWCPKDLTDHCLKYNIHFQAYSSFGGSGNDSLLKNQQLRQIAAEKECSVEHLLLAFALCQGYSVLPKSTNAEHIHDNFAATNVQLSEEDVERIRLPEQGKFSWDPETVV